MLRGSLEVVEFEPCPVIADAAPPICPPESEGLLSRCLLSNRKVAACASALAALAFHILLVAPALWGEGPFRPPQDERHRGDTALQWVVIEDSSGNSGLTGISSLPTVTMRAIRLSDPLPAPPTLPAQAANPQSDGQSGLSAMSGRYLAQIRARIERAWLLPRTAIGEPIFQCQVQLDQDSAGRVLAIALVACAGATAWQLSLVHAIEAASPLPAPPNPAVFVHHVLLTFRAMPYSAASSAALYERPRPVATDRVPANQDGQSQHALRALSELRAPSGKSVTLRIEGSQVDVEPEQR